MDWTAIILDRLKQDTALIVVNAPAEAGLGAVADAALAEYVASVAEDDASVTAYIDGRLARVNYLLPVATRACVLMRPQERAA